MGDPVSSRGDGNGMDTAKDTTTGTEALMDRHLELARKADAASGELLHELTKALGEEIGDALFCAIVNVVRTHEAFAVSEHELMASNTPTLREQLIGYGGPEWAEWAARTGASLLSS